MARFCPAGWRRFSVNTASTWANTARNKGLRQALRVRSTTLSDHPHLEVKSDVHPVKSRHLRDGTGTHVDAGHDRGTCRKRAGEEEPGGAGPPQAAKAGGPLAVGAPPRGAVRLPAARQAVPLGRNRAARL